MKKVLSIRLPAILLSSLCACGKTEQKAAGEFKPALDTGKSAKDCRDVGNYNNFEALEAIFDDFNRYYPNVALSYLKPDNYNNNIGIILDSDNAPNIYFNFNWMYGRDTYEASFRHAEDLSDPALGFDLSCIRQNLLMKDKSGALPMVPAFATTYGMLVNEDLFAKEGLEVPTTFSGLLSVCAALKEKGYPSPMMPVIFRDCPDPSLAYALVYPYYCNLVADDPDAVAAANNLSSEAGETMRPVLEYMMNLVDNGCIDLEECRKLEDDYSAMILRFFRRETFR